MKELIHNHLIVKKSPIHGFGVFADEHLLAGEMIEECYVLPISNNNEDLENYCFTGNKKWILPLGNGAVYNHSNKPNAECEYDAKKKLLTFKAKRFIAKNEEIFVSYGKRWFKDRNIKPKMT